VFVPGVEQSGACAGGTNEVDRQISPAVVGQSEPGLNVLQRRHVTVRPDAAVHAHVDGQMAADVPVKQEKGHMKTAVCPRVVGSALLKSLPAGSELGSISTPDNRVF